MVSISNYDLNENVNKMLVQSHMKKRLRGKGYVCVETHHQNPTSLVSGGGPSLSSESVVRAHCERGRVRKAEARHCPRPPEVPVNSTAVTLLSPLPPCHGLNCFSSKIYMLNF